MQKSRRSIMVTDKTHRELKSLKAELFLKGEELNSMERVIQWLINFWKKSRGERKDGV